MNPLNYCRQLALQFRAALEIPSLDRNLRALYENVIDLHRSSTKFLLPEGGRLFDDKQFRALDESEPLRLPYPSIALEYQVRGGRGPDDPIYWVNGAPVFEDESFESAPKRVVFAREMEGAIVVTVLFWTAKDSVWRVLPECAIPMTEYLDRQNAGPRGTPIAAMFNCPSKEIGSYADELGALISFLNVLQCSNVHIERNEPKTAGKKIKSALPFDAYHVLTIGAPGKAGDGHATGGHRSPREHLRRGHIRRLADGRRIWVNATVVAAGRAAGVVTKDYAVRCSA